MTGTFAINTCAGKAEVDVVLTVGWWQMRPAGLYEKYAIYYMVEGEAWSYSVPGRGYAQALPRREP